LTFVIPHAHPAAYASVLDHYQGEVRGERSIVPLAMRRRRRSVGASASPTETKARCNMSKLTRWDPFESRFPEIFRGFFAPVTMPSELALDFKVDFAENDDHYRIQAEIPGVKKDDINVQIDGNLLTISAEVKKESEEKKGKTIRSERMYGAVKRSFSLDSDIDAAKVLAKYESGVLTLTLPKKPGSAAKRITIQ
jgi:HSP20 family protein